jgi:hypothetical protein
MSGRRSMSYAILAALVIVCGGCATTPAAPPPGGVQADVAFPSPGTRWVTRTTDQSGVVSTLTLTALEEGAYEGKPVYRLSDGTEIRIFDRATRNFVATVRDGKERIAASPHDGTLSSPLWVGKSWRSTYTLHSRDRGRSDTVGVSWRAETYEEVTVPAGTFKAFKLVSTPGVNNASYYTVWYAPDPGLVVKQIYESPQHFMGPGKFTTELMELMRR